MKWGGDGDHEHDGSAIGPQVFRLNRTRPKESPKHRHLKEIGCLISTPVAMMGCWLARVRTTDEICPCLVYPSWLMGLLFLSTFHIIMPACPSKWTCPSTWLVHSFPTLVCFNATYFLFYFWYKLYISLFKIITLIVIYNFRFCYKC